MSLRLSFALAVPMLLGGCPASSPAPSSADPGDQARVAEVVVCAQPAEPATVEEQAAADDAALAIEADGDFVCANCGCDCAQATCATANCIAQATGQGDCKQSGSNCNGTTCSCDCYTNVGKACPAPGSTSRSPERITLTNGVGGVTAACAFR